MTRTNALELPGARPFYIPTAEEDYLNRHGGAYVLKDLPLEVRAEIAAGIDDNEAKAAQHLSTAPYVGRLALRFSDAYLTHRKYALDTENLEQTRLTSLLSERYDVEIQRPEGPVPGSARSEDAPLVLTSANRGPDTEINYRLDLGSHTIELWSIFIDPSYGYVNLKVSEASLTSLSGEADIALVPGVEEALTADAELLLKNVPTRSD